MTLADTEAQKRAAAEAAVAEVQAGMLVGLGTGSTAAYAVAALGRAALPIRAVATSDHTVLAAQAAGIEVIDMGAIAVVDLAIDGVDEIDPGFRAIKGAGGAMLREKVVATAARRMVAIADASKAVAALGGRPVPVEVLPFAQALVAAQIERLGGVPVLRQANGVPVRSDSGNLILDCHFAMLDDPERLETELAAVPGLLGHGLFLREIDALYLGTATGVKRTNRAA